MDKGQEVKYKTWGDYWNSFDSFSLALQNSDRGQITELLEEAKLHVNGMTDGWFEFVDIFENAINSHKDKLNKTELADAIELIDFIRKPLTRQQKQQPTTGFKQVGQTEGKSAVNRYCTSSRLDGILIIGLC